MSYNITYEGLGSEVKKQTEIAGIEVIGIAELSISNIKTDPLNIKQGNDFTLLVRIENAGGGDAKSVKATITDLPFSGVKEAFLGKIEPDDDSLAVFTLIPNESGNFDYHLQISYKDDSGDHTITEKLSLVVEGNENNGILNVIIIAILIALAGTCFYFYSKKKKKG